MTIRLSKLLTFNGPVEDLSISTRQDGNLHLQLLFWAWGGGLLYKFILVKENWVALMDGAMLVLKVFSWWIVVIFLLLPADLNQC